MIIKIFLIIIILYVILNESQKIEEYKNKSDKLYLKPINIKKYNIYDVFYNNYDKKIMLIIPNLQQNNPKIQLKVNNKITNFDVINNSRIYIYSIKSEYKKEINLIINREMIKTQVNKYPEFKNEIIYSTMVKNEDNYIRQWIEYHLNLGVQRFIIYDNSETSYNSYKSVEKESNLPLVLEDYIKKNIVYLVKWQYAKRYTKYKKKSAPTGQTIQMNHSLYNFRSSKYIGFFDIDEYLNPQEDNNINNFFNILIKKNNINIYKISGFRISTKYFYNSEKKNVKDYNFFKIYNCSSIREIQKNRNGYGSKMIIIPKNTKILKSVHYLYKTMYIVDPKLIYINHYYFLNKENRGLNKTNLIDKSIDKHTKIFKNKIFYRNTNELIEKTIDKINNNDVIITFVDKNRINKFNIFYKNIKQLNLNNLLVIALDTDTYNKINNLTSTILLENDKENLETINKIFKLGKKDLIYTNIEYIWKKDLSKQLKYVDYDLISIKDKKYIIDSTFFKVQYNIDTIYLFDKIINKFYNKNKNMNTKINNFILDEKIDVLKDKNNNKIIKFNNKNFNILVLNKN